MTSADRDRLAIRTLTFVYRNWRGEVSDRRVQPIAIRFGTTEWHPEPQWLLRAVDLDKGAEREFAMKDMLGARPAAPAGEVEPVAWRWKVPFPAEVRGSAYGWAYAGHWSTGPSDAEPLYASPIDPAAIRAEARREAMEEALTKAAGRIDDLALELPEGSMRRAWALEWAGEARAAIRALKSATGDGWRPIETAPKDGTNVLLFCPRGDGNPGSTYRVTIGCWESDPGGTTEYRDAQGQWTGQDDREGFEGWLSWDGGFSEDTMMPTHWRPLPAPPSGGRDEG